MIRKPTQSEWDMSQLPETRRSYLDSGLSFDQIAARIVAEAEILRPGMIEPYGTPGRFDPRQARQARQVIFRIRVCNDTCDLFYNAPDGLRGRYWQTPDHGWLATRNVINALSGALIASTDSNPPTVSNKATPMDRDDIRASLGAPSAKIWPREWDDGRVNQLLVDDQLVVPRWEENEKHSMNREWRKSPKGGKLEIKGAILGPDGTEYVPEGKRDRSYQIHHSGFT